MLKEFFDCIKTLIKKTDKNSSIDLIFSNSCMEIQQSREEFEELIKIFRDLNPKRMLEIGTYKGGSLYIFSRQIDNLNMISIDFPMVGERLKWLKTFLIKRIPLKNQKLWLLREDSHKKETLNHVKEILGNSKLDFLHIDADHSYRGVKKDFEMYSHLIRKGGIIAFHDIKSVKGVIRFWGEIKEKYKGEEILAKDKKNIIGIGIIKKEV